MEHSLQDSHQQPLLLVFVPFGAPSRYTKVDLCEQQHTVKVMDITLEIRFYEDNGVWLGGFACSCSLGLRTVAEASRHVVSTLCPVHEHTEGN